MHWYNYCCIKYKLNKFQLFIKSKWLNDGILLVFSPRMWRWSQGTHFCNSVTVSFLHVCGGDPKYDAMYYNDLKFSPRMWRWSCLAETFSGGFTSFLHVCGGDPNLYEAYMQSKKFSPRMWRWSTSYTVLGTIFGGFLHVCGGDPVLTGLKS